MHFCESSTLVSFTKWASVNAFLEHLAQVGQPLAHITQAMHKINFSPILPSRVCMLGITLADSVKLQKAIQSA